MMNLVIIISDALRRDHLGCYGNDWIHTPHLGRFAESCVVFDQAYWASFPTMPRRACDEELTAQFTAIWPPTGQRFWFCSGLWHYCGGGRGRKCPEAKGPSGSRGAWVRFVRTPVCVFTPPVRGKAGHEEGM